MNMLQRVEPYVTYGCVCVSLSLSPTDAIRLSLKLYVLNFVPCFVNWIYVIIDIPT
jgi:hypothetical protein